MRAEWHDAGGIFLPNTPNSLVELGQPEKAKEVVRHVQDRPNVVLEFQSILIANKVMENTETPGAPYGEAVACGEKQLIA